MEDTDELNPVARVILHGLYDAGSPFHLLAGMHYILKAIWQNVLTCYKSSVGKGHNYDLSYVKVKWGHFYTSSDSHADWLVRFPEPSDIDINMMPFVMAKRFKETKLPAYLRTYWDQMLDQCIVRSELDKIGYLTIQESFVKKSSTQRRPGIHTESPGVVMFKEGKGKLDVQTRVFSWGSGVVSTTQELHGGIYMASNVPNSCKIWNCKILRPHGNSPDVVGEHGNIEHLRAFLPSSCEVLNANTVYWFTDRTPHEALPLAEGTYRQFFRLVTSEVAYWYEEHSTKNPNGVVPDPNITKIVKGSKFDGSCYVVDP